MMRRGVAAVSLAALSFAAFGQSSSPQPAFEVADVHKTPRVTSAVMRTALRGGRYELLNATVVDLIRTAYGIDAESVVGGPNWVEFDRFDVIAKAASATPPETLRPMLQALLADRFKLVVHNDAKPMATRAPRSSQNARRSPACARRREPRRIRIRDAQPGAIRAKQWRDSWLRTSRASPRRCRVFESACPGSASGSPRPSLRRGRR